MVLKEVALTECYFLQSPKLFIFHRFGVHDLYGRSG
jgi:hypothetical protein